MNQANPYIKQYKKNQIETASPEQILILLYDGAINYLNRAKNLLNDEDEEQFHKNMLGCKNIIAEFMESLDLEMGGDWAVMLYNLYKYLRKIIVKSDITKDINGIDEVLKHLTSLRETWLKAIEIAKAEKASSLIDEYKPENQQETTSYKTEYDKYEEDEDDLEDDYENEDDDEDDEDDEDS